MRLTSGFLMHTHKWTYILGHKCACIHTWICTYLVHIHTHIHLLYQLLLCCYDMTLQPRRLIKRKVYFGLWFQKVRVHFGREAWQQVANINAGIRRWERLLPQSQMQNSMSWMWGEARFTFSSKVLPLKVSVTSWNITTNWGPIVKYRSCSYFFFLFPTTTPTIHSHKWLFINKTKTENNIRQLKFILVRTGTAFYIERSLDTCA